jgi:hypothetical protein
MEPRRKSTIETTSYTSEHGSSSKPDRKKTVHDERDEHDSGNKSNALFESGRRRCDM